MFKFLKKNKNNEQKHNEKICKDSWMPSVDVIQRRNEEIWNTLTQEEIKAEIFEKAQKGEVSAFFFNRKISEQDKKDLKELGYYVEERLHYGAPLVVVSWQK